jgi:hypothetical protein
MAIDLRTCMACGEDYVPKRPEQKTCSVRCRNTYVARVSALKRGDTLRGRRTTGRGRYVKEGGRYQHRVAAEQILGRPLRPGEVVHHLDGNKHNNSPFNVIVMPSPAAHSRCEKRGADKARARGQRID